MRYSNVVGLKFNKNGDVIEFKGNTFLCHLKQKYKLIDEIKWAQDRLKMIKCAYKFSFLPMNSMHMTVFECICDQVREPEYWTGKFRSDANLSDITEMLMAETERIGPFGGFEMAFDSVYNCSNGGTALRIKPANVRTEREISGCRETLSHVTGIRHPNFNSYHFHISLSYKIIELDKQEEEELGQTSSMISERLSRTFGVLKLGPVEFCFFNDMFKFIPLRVLDK